jgi:hypothetical protein
MSVERGLTTLVVRTGWFTAAYRWNMPLRQAVRTFGVIRGQRRRVLACGPVIVEW